MDKIEKIRQEIERLKKENENIKCDSNKAYCQGYDDAFVDLLPFFDTLSEEPDKSLEDAAENYIAPIENDEGLDYINFNGRDIKDAFIAGAEWQKSQMLSEAVEGEAEELYNDGESQCVVSVGTYFEPEDKVYVLKAEED